VHTVYYLDLVTHSGRQPLPMGRIVAAALKTMLSRALSGAGPGPQVLNPWTRGLMDKLDNLKFLAYVGDDGHPNIVPIIQAQAAGSAEIIFATGAFGSDLEAIPRGATVAIFGMSLQMEDVLLRGEYRGLERRAGLRCGSVSVHWVYSPMPPKPQQIYPPLPLEAVRRFP
jgi:hypothetical protein